MQKGSNEIWVALRLLRKNGTISKQAFRTYAGQIRNGQEEAAIKGLLRKGLIRYE